jgi:iron uptake system component EfeO
MKILLPAAAAVLAVGLAACTSQSSDTADATTVAVTSSASACDVSPTQAPAGTIVFSVSNTGDEPTELYLLASDDSIVGEVENVGPGVSRDLVVDAAAGDYTALCKPGMVGDGIPTEFTVTDS